MKKIGVMGGTFNPIHKGHIEIAKAAYEQYALDVVWFMPNHIPAYKSDLNIVSGAHRLAMTELAISGIPYFETSDFELTRSGKTYSYETFSLLDELYSDACFFFIMGADSLFYFEKWVKPEVILQHAHILAAPRDMNRAGEIIGKISQLNAAYPEVRISLVECAFIPCSSSEIRVSLSKMYDAERDSAYYLKTERNLLQYISRPVLDYILEQQLYNQVWKWLLFERKSVKIYGNNCRLAVSFRYICLSLDIIMMKCHGIKGRTWIELRWWRNWRQSWWIRKNYKGTFRRCRKNKSWKTKTRCKTKIIWK